MNLFDVIGSFFGKKKKKEDNPQPQAIVRTPAPFKNAGINRGAAVRPTVSASPTFIPGQPQQEDPRKLAEPLNIELGGVKPAAPKPVDNTNRFKIEETLPSVVRGVGKGGLDLASTVIDASTGKLFGKNWAPELTKNTAGISKVLSNTSESLEKRQLEKNNGNAANNFAYSVGQVVDPATIAGGVLKVGSKVAPKVAPKVGNFANDLREMLSGNKATEDVLSLPTERTQRINQRNVDEALRQGEQRANISTVDPSYQKRNTPEVTASAGTQKPPAITSPNRPATPTAPKPFSVAQAVGNTPPTIQGVQLPATPMPKPQVPLATTPDEATAIAQKAIDDAATQAPVQPASSQVLQVEAPPVVQAPVVSVNPAQVAQEAVAKAPTDAIAESLGTITRKSVLNGSINTPEGVDKAISDVTAAATREAEATGATLDEIIRRGQRVWQESKTKKRDLTTSEALAFDKKFTSEQQAVYKAYAQEIGTLRERGGFDLSGGSQGAWYGPRQSLVDDGADLKSAEFDPTLVNEMKRNKDQANGGVEDYLLDTSAVPYEQAIRRYANASGAGTQRLVQAAETDPITGNPTGIKIPDQAKENLENTLKGVTEKRDKALKAEADGDKKTADGLHKEAEKDIRKAFNDFIDDIPGTGKERRAAINSVKAMRGTYEQTLTGTITLSNVVNRLADQGTKVVEAAKRPLIRGLEKVIGATTKGPGALNTTKEARKAARNFAKGTMSREITDNAKAVVSMAGAGRNPIAKGIAKADATVRAGGGAIVQAGDLSTSNVREALQIGASRPEAAGLKTVQDYEKYYAEYINTQAFQDDLAKVAEVQNPKIGLAGGEIQKNGGKVSNGLSKYLDNGITTGAERAKPGLGKNRGVREVNDYVKGNLTGYAGVGSRVAGTFVDAAVPIRTVKNAVKEMKSGDPVAAARGTKMMAHAVGDTIALYGTAGAATALANSGVVGYTGGQPVRGSSESSYNKSNTIPPNQWFVNVGDKRVYFDPARPAGAAGVGADIAGSLATGAKNTVSTATNVLGQVYDQAGGGSIPQSITNAITGYADTGAPEGTKKYARDQTAALLAPATGVLNNIANWADPIKRAPKGFVENLKSNLPVLRAQTPESKDSRGNTIANSKQVSGGSSVFSVGKNVDSKQSKGVSVDSVDAEITRLQKLGTDVFPTNSNTNATDKRTQGNSKLLMDSSLYKNADDKKKAEYLHEALIGTKTKDISDKVNDTDRKALIEYTLQSDQERKKWLDSNENSSGYYTAKYSNLAARDLLTSDDDNLENKSGAKYKMVRAQVDKELGADSAIKQLYEDVSATEWKAMTDPESDEYDPDTAEKLLAYDDARTKAGVSGKDSSSAKNKFVLKVAKGSGKGKGRGSGGGSGSGSGSAGDNFGFASLPASLIGTKENGKYADEAPTFKPIADLKASRADIPDRRTISVKKGIRV